MGGLQSWKDCCSIQTQMLRNQPTHGCYKHLYTRIQRQRQNVVVLLDDGKYSRKMSRHMRKLMKHFHEVPLLVFCKAFSKHSNILPTFPLHAKPSISDSDHSPPRLNCTAVWTIFNYTARKPHQIAGSHLLLWSHRVIYIPNTYQR